DEELAHEGVADLHGHPHAWPSAGSGCIVRRTLRRAPLAELVARHGGAVDAVAAGLRPDVEDAIAHAARAAIEDAVGSCDAAGERVDEDVAVVAGVELHLAADRGHADAVAVTRDAGDDATEQLGGPWVVGAAEAEGVEAGDGAGAHREDIAQD